MDIGEHQIPGDSKAFSLCSHKRRFHVLIRSLSGLGLTYAMLQICCLLVLSSYLIATT